MKKNSSHLTVSEIKTGLKSLPGWHYLPKHKAIGIECKMKDFMTAVNTIQRIAKLAEKAGHHPNLYLTRYRYLKILLSTHGAGGVTRKDFQLAKQIHL